MGAKSFFKKVGRGLQSGAGQFTNAVGRGAESVFGSALAKSALEAAPLMLLKTGERIPGKKNKAMPFIAYGNEYVLPANATPTKKQKAIVASNKRKQKNGVKFV